MQYRDDIDGLRAVAVILIVFFHVRLTNVPGGFVGVDVFFVISGFLITKLITKEVAQDRFSFGHFYLRRLRRLGPALLVTIALTLAVGWFILPPMLYQSTAQAAIATLLSVSNILFWLQTGYFDIEAAYKPLLHTWSLAVEEQFYLIWPVTLLIALRLLTPRGLIAAIIIVSAMSLAFGQALLAQNPSASFYLTPFRIFAFGAGAILAVTGWEARNVATANIASLCGLLIIFYVAGNLTESDPFPGINSAIPAFATAMMIYAGPTALMNRVLALAPIRYIGRISYSVYLMHWPLIVYYIFLYGQVKTLIEILGLVALTLGVGALMYHAVETPFRLKRGNAFWVTSKALGFGSLVFAAIIGILSWQISDQRGYPTRYAPEIRTLLAQLDTAIAVRTEASGEFTCNATTNSQDVYFDGFADCLPTGTDNLIVVLGDSHAADVYMGLRAAFPNKNVVQLTGNGCNMTKALDGNTFCAPFMRFWQTWIMENAADIDAIIYSQSGGSLLARGAGGVERPDRALMDTLTEGLQKYRVDGVPFVFWGPRPGFEPSIAVAIAGSNTLDGVRNYYSEASFSVDYLLDTRLEAYFADKEIHYVSSMQSLCDPQCPTLTTADALFIVDHAHWSVAGAIEATQKIIASDPSLRAYLAN